MNGPGKRITLSDAMMSQITLTCGCRVEHCSVYSHSTALIGAKRFTAGEPLCKGKRCGSVFTRVLGGRSVYGLVKDFVRVRCNCMRCYDFALVTYFPYPAYPDSDPLTVRIDIGGLDVNKLDRVCIISLYVIQPARVAVRFDSFNGCMYDED